MSFCTQKRWGQLTEKKKNLKIFFFFWVGGSLNTHTHTHHGTVKRNRETVDKQSTQFWRPERQTCVSWKQRRRRRRRRLSLSRSVSPFHGWIDPDRLELYTTPAPVYLYKRSFSDSLTRSVYLPSNWINSGGGLYLFLMAAFFAFATWFPDKKSMTTAIFSVGSWRKTKQQHAVSARLHYIRPSFIVVAFLSGIFMWAHSLLLRPY